MREKWFPHEVHKVASNFNKWPGYERAQLRVIKQCVDCKRNYDNSCMYPLNKQPDCNFFIKLKEEDR